MLKKILSSLFLFAFKVRFNLAPKALEFLRCQKGVTAIEYALIAVAISTMLFLVLGSGGEDGLVSKIQSAFKSIQNGLSINSAQGQ